MKKILLLSFIISALSVQGQSLKDALYGGKLRLDSGTVIRKGDDLSSKIDTSTRKPVERQQVITTVDTVYISADSMTFNTKVDTVIFSSDSIAIATDAPKSVNDPAAANRDNNKVWKDYMEELVTSMKTDVLPSKKIKSGSYSILIDYVIETDGSITVNSVSSSPQSDYLEQQIKNRLSLTSPQMTPLLSANGKPRKAPKKHTFTLLKN